MARPFGRRAAGPSSPLAADAGCWPIGSSLTPSAVSTNRSSGFFRSEKDEDATAPFERRAPQTREGVGLKAGALLAREWKGRLERVMILEEGFVWNGQTFGSLSQIAKAMTGTNWNGHRFFGLRQGRRLRRVRTGSAERTGDAWQRRPPMAHRLETRRHEGDEQTQFPLRDLYARLDQPRARTGLQFSDAQREASEAYIKSQAHEGWRLMRDRYDDGGYSGRFDGTAGASEAARRCRG